VDPIAEERTAVSTVVDRIDYHFDPLCPFAYQTSLWIREVREQAGLQVDWRFFSLEEINHVEGKKHPWERDWSYGWSLMRIGALLRRRDMAELDAWYARIGSALHREGGKPHDPTVAHELMREVGLDPALVDEALDDATTHEEVRADHDRVVAAGGFGVPTLFFPDGQAVFGPVVIDPPRGEQALRLWDVVRGWTEFPNLYEIQRPKGPADQRAIAESLQPYLQGRDWDSINRGQRIDIPGDPRRRDRTEAEA
jgi:2-hydroxychromene-2-carboxylate isomerase